MTLLTYRERCAIERQSRQKRRALVLLTFLGALAGAGLRAIL